MNFKKLNKVDDGIIVIDDFLKEVDLNNLIKILDKLDWDNCYSQKGLRAACEYKKKSYKKNVNNFKIIERLRNLIFSDSNLKTFYEIIKSNQGQLNYPIKILIKNLNRNRTEKGLTNNIFEKFIVKYIRNPLYKSSRIKDIFRKFRMCFFGPKFHTTFSISKTNGSYGEGPHVDQRNKVIVGLIYLDNTAQNSYSNLTFWKTKNNAKVNFNENLYVINTPLEKIKSINQKRNRLVLFANSEKAIHSAIGNTDSNRRFIYFSIVSTNDS